MTITTATPSVDDVLAAARAHARPLKLDVLSVIIPMYNEAATVETIVRQVLDVDLPVAVEIIAVDDASHDDSAAIVESIGDPRITVIRQSANAGKGSAIRAGIAAATGEYVVIQDADLEYDPADWARMLPVLLSGLSDVVYGSRFMGDAIAGMRWQNRIANQALSLLTSVLYRKRLTDMETCYKMAARPVLAGLGLTSDRFDIEPEITARLLRGGHNIIEVPISYDPRTHDAGKKIGWRDGVEAVRAIVRWWLVLPRRKN